MKLNKSIGAISHLSVNGFVEGPSVAGVLLAEHLPQHLHAVLEALGEPVLRLALPRLALPPLLLPQQGSHRRQLLGTKQLGAVALFSPPKGALN